MTGRHVVIIGGGLAGISAAIGLRDAGIDVTLLEAKGWLGGATCSFSRGGLAIDNGQHVFLRCCTAYTELLARLGMTGSVAIQDRFDVTVLTPGGQARLRRSGLPAPLHMAGALARYSLLSPVERLKVGRAALAMRFAKPDDAALDRIRLGDWLGARWQGERARRRLWDLFIVSSLNIAGDEASAALSAKVIRTALLEDASAADIGVPSIPLGRLHGQAAEGLLSELGVDVRLGVKTLAVEPGGADGGFCVRAVARAVGSEPSLRDDDGPNDLALTDGPRHGAPGEVLRADGVVLAVPAWDAARLVPAGVSADWANLQPSPIVNVHVIYDRPVTNLPFAAAVDSPVQWVFDKTRQAGVLDGQYLVVSQSAADGYIGRPAAALREQFLPALTELFPAARAAEVRDFFVTRERRATFRQAPGCGAMRPGAATSLTRLVLAGAWTDTGWPDTMEGAVRSGLTAAAQIQRELAGAVSAVGQGRARRMTVRESAGTPS
jgi:uncharacterized protein with NAD-binding domain and iron-sulfur cluster